MKKGRRFTISAAPQAPEPRAIKLEPDDLAVYVRRAEKKVLPIIREGQWNRAPPSLNECDHRQKDER